MTSMEQMDVFKGTCFNPGRQFMVSPGQYLNNKGTVTLPINSRLSLNCALGKSLFYFKRIIEAGLTI